MVLGRCLEEDGVWVRSAEQARLAFGSSGFLFFWLFFFFSLFLLLLLLVVVVGVVVVIVGYNYDKLS